MAEKIRLICEDFEDGIQKLIQDQPLECDSLQMKLNFSATSVSTSYTYISLYTM